MDTSLDPAISMFNTLCNIGKRFLACDWGDPALFQDETRYIITNTEYVVLTQFLLCLAMAIPLHDLVGHAYAIRDFYNMPPQQVGGFTLGGSSRRIRYTVVYGVITSICLCVIVVGHVEGFNVTNTPGDTQYISIHGVLLEGILSMTMVLYVFYHEHIIYRQIARRTSIIYLTSRYPSITHHNADVFCEHFGLDVFPVKTFERLHYDKPTLTLYDLEKLVTNARPYIDFMTEVKDTKTNLRCIQPVIIPTQC